MKLLSNENNMSPEIINFLKKKTKTKGFDKKEKQDIEEHIDVQIKDNNKDTDIQILLELIEEEPEEEIKTDLIIKKLIKRKETKN